MLRLSREQKQLSSLAFFAQVRQSFPFPIRKVQTDHGTEFSLDFVLGVEQAGDPASLHPAAGASILFSIDTLIDMLAQLGTRAKVAPRTRRRRAGAI